MTEQVILGSENDDTVLTDGDGGTEEVSSDDKDSLLTEGEDGDTKDKDGQADEPAGAPEKYEDFTLPEGVVLEQSLMESITPLFKELGLSQDGAQKLIDLQVINVQKEADAQKKAWQDTMTGWVDKSKNDKEIGGQLFNESLSLAKEALTAFGTKDFNNMLAVTGVGNHPEMVRFLVKLGKTMKEHDVLQASDKGTKPVDLATMLYPTMVNTG